MHQFTEGDRVRVDIPDLDDPDHDMFHGRYGVVVDAIKDDTGTATDDKRDNLLYRVELEDGTRMDFRWRDLRPP